MPVAFDTESEVSSDRFEFRQGETTPFVIPVSEERDVAEEDALLGVELTRIPCPRTCGIEEFTDDDGVGSGFLSSDFREAGEEFFCEKFHEV